MKNKTERLSSTFGLEVQKAFKKGKCVCTRIINYSDFTLWLSLKPKPPKRKVVDRFVVEPKSFLLMECEINFSDIYLSFDERG